MKKDMPHWYCPSTHQAKLQVNDCRCLSDARRKWWKSSIHLLQWKSCLLWKCRFNVPGLSILANALFQIKWSTRCTFFPIWKWNHTVKTFVISFFFWNTNLVFSLNLHLFGRQINVASALTLHPAVSADTSVERSSAMNSHSDNLVLELSLYMRNLLLRLEVRFVRLR